jgi:mannose-6-phosphate isomerase-like protein (cupin superfamily)
MRASMISFGLAMGVTALLAQQKGAPPEPKNFSSAADVQGLIAKSKSERKENQPLVAQRILSAAPYNANLEYRAAVGPASVHPNEAEMFYVIEGSGTLVTGGKLITPGDGKAKGGAQATIEGGDARPVAKGDFVMVPEGVNHWFSKIDGTLVLMSIHLPRPLPQGK